MNRPKILHIGGTLYWVLRTRNPDTQVLKDADSTPSVAIRKNSASTGDSVTITKRSATTGIYDCSYNPASEIEGDEFTVEESATVTGTTTSSATYTASWEFTVVAIERGTNFANTIAPATPTNVSDVQTALLAAINALNNLSAADVNDEVLDVLNVDTFAEETGVPAATSSLRKKIGWMFMWFRNRVTQTGTTSTLFADDGSTAVGTHTVSDDTTTFTSGEGA